MKKQRSVLEDVLEKLSVLRELGKEASEMDFWETVAPHLTPAEQVELLRSLTEEAALLRHR